MVKLLVIEDDEYLLQYLSLFLTQKGYEVVSAINGEIGLELFELEKPDLVLTDIIMPEVEGIEVIMKLRDTHADLPIIAMSAGLQNSAEIYLEMAQKLGATSIIKKPLDMPELLSGIENLLSNTK